MQEKTHWKEEKEIQLCDNFVQTCVRELKNVYLYMVTHNAQRIHGFQRYINNNNSKMRLDFSGQWTYQDRMETKPATHSPTKSETKCND